MSVLSLLASLRAHAGERLTHGLDDADILRLATSHPQLSAAIEAAVLEHAHLAREFGDLLDLDEAAQICTVQAGFVNFYADDVVTPMCH